MEILFTLSVCQSLRMPAQMIAHEGGDEIVAVIVTFLPAQGEGDAGLLAGRLQQIWPELLLHKLIGIAVVDQKFAKFRAVLDQGDRIVLAPASLVVAEIAAKRLGPPGHLGRRYD